MIISRKLEKRACDSWEVIEYLFTANLVLGDVTDSHLIMTTYSSNLWQHCYSAQIPKSLFTRRPVSSYTKEFTILTHLGTMCLSRDSSWAFPPSLCARWWPPCSWASCASRSRRWCFLPACSTYRPSSAACCTCCTWSTWRGTRGRAHRAAAEMARRTSAPSRWRRSSNRTLSTPPSCRTSCGNSWFNGEVRVFLSQRENGGRSRGAFTTLNSRGIVEQRCSDTPRALVITAGWWTRIDSKSMWRRSLNRYRKVSLDNLSLFQTLTEFSVRLNERLWIKLF